MKKINIAVIIAFMLTLLSGCAAVSKETSGEAASLLSITDISDGLPTKGLWRENIALYDMNGDGFLDIIAPPPRKAEKGQDRPFVFIWNAIEKKWTEGKYDFPGKGGYYYGGVAVGDINNDGHPDIALAQHGGNITLFTNDGRNFVESQLPAEEEFHSRAIVFSDLNGDGKLDIVAVSEAPFSPEYKPKGILVGLNKEGRDWDVMFVKDSIGLFADSVAVGNLRGSGHKDIAIAALTPEKEMQKLIWFGDGKGEFKQFIGDLFAEDAIPVIVRTGDVDGDGTDEVAFGLALIGGGSKEKGRLAVMKWNGAGFKDISEGLDLGYIIAFDLVDIDGDGRCELVVLTETGIHIYKYNGMRWDKQGHYPIPMTDVSSVTDLKAGRNKDGSVVIVYNLGKREAEGLSRGIRAYLLR